VNQNATALVALGYAAAHQLSSITLEVDHAPDCAPARVFHDTNTIVLRAGLPVDEVLVLMQRCLDVLCPVTVVERDDGGTAWAVGAADGTHGPGAVASRARPALRLV
jgi:hypothetical protein